MNGSFKLYLSLRLRILSGKLRQIFSTALKILKKNKVVRTAGIPEILDKNYYVHLEHYKKFILAVSLEKRKKKKKTINVAEPNRQKVSLNALNEIEKFGENCGIYKKRQRKVGPKYQYPKPIRTTDAEKNLKEAAKLRKDETFLLEIHEVDLISKEFKNHEKCYRDYTRILYPNKN